MTQTTIPYRRSDAETAFLLKWAEALGATPDEARVKLAELDEKDAKSPKPQRVEVPRWRNVDRMEYDR